MIGIEGDRLVGAGERFLKALELSEGVRAIIEGLCVIWRELDRLIVAADSFLEPSEFSQNIASVVVRHGEPRMDGDRLIAASQSLIEASETLKRNRAVQLRERIEGLVRGRERKVLLGRCVVAP